jgi:hypothetical protein
MGCGQRTIFSHQTAFLRMRRLRKQLLIQQQKAVPGLERYAISLPK